MTGRLWCLAFAALFGALPQVRPSSAQIAGTASIDGTVVDDRSGAPLRHALVQIAGNSLERPSSINTDDAGQFRFDGLPAGSYSLYISATGFLRNELGARRPGGPTVPIVLSDREARTGVVVRMVRGGVVTGRLLDLFGEPVPRVAVALQQWTTRKDGSRSLSQSASMSQTDDRGVYRITEVPAGEYVVMTTMESLMGGFSTGPGVDHGHIATRAEVEAVRNGATTPPRTPEISELRTRVLKSVTFYPGTTRASDATTIVVVAGEERTGIDFTAQYLPSRTIRGRIVLPGGAAPLRTVVQLFSPTGVWTGMQIREDASHQDNAFVVADIPPGDYVLGVQVFLPPAEASERWSATMPLVVADRDVSDIVLTPSAGVVVEGRVQFEGTAPSPERANALRIALMANVPAGQIIIGAPPVAIAANGAFRISGVMPGKYSFELASAERGDVAAGWWMKSASLSGLDVTDAAIDVSSSNISQALVVLSQRIPAISGTLFDDRGAPVAGRRVVVFPSDRALWTSKSRRIVTTMTMPDGRFRLAPLPAGEYLIATAADLEDGDWRIPAVLEQLAPGALRVTLAEGEHKVIDLRARR